MILFSDIPLLLSNSVLNKKYINFMTSFTVFLVYCDVEAVSQTHLRYIDVRRLHV